MSGVRLAYVERRISSTCIVFVLIWVNHRCYRTGIALALKLHCHYAQGSAGAVSTYIHSVSSIVHSITRYILLDAFALLRVEMATMDQESVSAFRESFRKSKHIVIVAGAGLSAASGKDAPYGQLFGDLFIIFEGIPTFRDGGGMWRSLDATALATPEAFQANPSLVWQFYHYRRTK